ncbi:ABC transporter ATP-binding protein [uncultured Rhodoblastus sp.]|uniref:ABC transporter ATP-binding protein n=1 Tax=uncultured Rhodoblastus sp. TaxID=543037 RepID=UPI0025E2CB43|nr:ABC transporter ATP-binding protein [uncultured Rhodoblastus sp.]
MSAPALSIRNVSHVFGSGETAFTALREVDLDVRRGEILLLMGPSGSGKTTLLHILGGLLRPTSGSVRLNGKAIEHLGEEELSALRLKHFGFILQSYNLFPVLSATENVLVAFDLMRANLAEGRVRARELLRTVGLADKLDAFPAQLSGGQKQRIAIARALAGDPQFLLADEPTAALDADTGRKAMALFARLAHDQGRAVVIVTHDPRILPLADRIVHIEDGQIAPASDNDAQPPVFAGAPT